MAQNNELRQACEAWLRAVLSFLHDKSLLATNDIEVTFIKDGWQTRNVLAPDYSGLYMMHRENLHNLQEVYAVAHVIANSPSSTPFSFIGVPGQGNFDPIQQKDWLQDYYLYKFLMEYLRSTKTFTFLPEAFEDIYEKLEYYLYNIGPFSAVWLIDFNDLKLEIEMVPLEDDICLRQTTQKEQEQIIKELGLFNPVLRPFEVPKSYLEIHHTTTKLTFPDQQEATDIAQAVLLTLRLLKTNPIEISLYRWAVPNQPFWLPQSQTFLHQVTNLMFHSANFQHRSVIAGDRYVLTQEDANILPGLFKKAKKTLKNDKLRTTITRFADSYARAKLEDRLIDYWTALEALFFLEDEFQDMGKSLALAASYYLGSTSGERSTVYNDLTRSHTLRSHYIHGERKKTKHPLEEMAVKTEKHWRNALRKRIEEAEG